ncbi:capsid size determination protein [Pectobacterium aroidearum]|uniref:Capsid size determination protein n=1 Tax=Pectobacterium aroidearum TaxID=1201031 RepID=A0AAW3T0A7_9GAMM|nr:capsid size determination protein [Pectobacterium aroidearum]MBA5205505.1 capsid size determination protein [Pectobacterium aroidearum]
MSQITTPDTKPANALPETLKRATSYYLRMREEHTANAGELDNIDTAINRAKEQKANTEAENQLSDTDWRARFLAARGEMTAELKNQQLQRLAQRELAQEYDGLLAQLEIEQLRQKAKCSASAKDCCDAHASALRNYAEWEFNQALNSISTNLIRAIKLKLHMLDITTSEYKQGHAYQKPEKVVMDLITNNLREKADNYRFNMSNEAVLSSLGLNAPSLPHSYFEPVASPAQRMKFFRELKEKEDALKTRSQKV